MALLAAIALHALLVVLIATRVAPLVAEPPVMQVTLLELAPRARPPLDSRPHPVADSRSHPSRPPDRPAPPAMDRAPTRDWRVRPSDAPEADGVHKALRTRLGCRSADLLALTKAERTACEEALAKGAADAPTYAVISPKLKKVFDRTFECPKDDVWCEYRVGKGPYPGIFAPRKKKDPSWD